VRKPGFMRRGGPGYLAGLLADPVTAPVGAAAGQVDAPAPEFDEEQHLQPPPRDRRDREEIDREHARSLRSHEGTPGQPCPLAGRANSCLPQNLPHRRGRDADAEPVQLAPDALVAPARIRAPQPEHQPGVSSLIGVDGRSSCHVGAEESRERSSGGIGKQRQTETPRAVASHLDDDPNQRLTVSLAAAAQVGITAAQQALVDLGLAQRTPAPEPPSPYAACGRAHGSMTLATEPVVEGQEKARAV
jgi:hypothetical protein